jgi:hypothetical protein
LPPPIGFSLVVHIQYIYTKLRDLAREAIFAG